MGGFGSCLSARSISPRPRAWETWAKPHDFMIDAEIGAPPDILNPTGQKWGLPPFNPVALQKHRYWPFIELVRANMVMPEACGSTM